MSAHDPLSERPSLWKFRPRVLFGKVVVARTRTYRAFGVTMHSRWIVKWL